MKYVILMMENFHRNFLFEGVLLLENKHVNKKWIFYGEKELNECSLMRENVGLRIFLFFLAFLFMEIERRFSFGLLCGIVCAKTKICLKILFLYPPDVND